MQEEQPKRLGQGGKKMKVNRQKLELAMARLHEQCGLARRRRTAPAHGAKRHCGKGGAPRNIGAYC